jgi:hypothetical protein
MRSTSSTSPSEFLGALATAALLCASGCASTPPVPDAEAGPNSGQGAATAPATEPKSPVLGLEYGNRSSKATLQIDLGNQDVEVVMSGSLHRDTVRTTVPAPVAAAPAPAAAPAQAAPVAPTPPPEPDLKQARSIVDSAGAHRTSMPDSVTRRVVGAIRKAQEAFYKGRYQDADAEARKSVALWPTAEGWALLGSVAWVRGDKAEARKSWLRARELDPDFPGLDAFLDSTSARQEVAP